jgi:hypothetical protein
MECVGRQILPASSLHSGARCFAMIIIHVYPEFDFNLGHFRQQNRGK